MLHQHPGWRGVPAPAYVCGTPTCALYGEITATLAVLRSWGKACISSR